MIFSDSNYQIITIQGVTVSSPRLSASSREQRWNFIWDVLKSVSADGWSLYNIFIQELFVCRNIFLFYVSIFHVSPSWCPQSIFRITIALLWHNILFLCNTKYFWYSIGVCCIKFPWELPAEGTILGLLYLLIGWEKNWCPPRFQAARGIF